MFRRLALLVAIAFALLPTTVLAQWAEYRPTGIGYAIDMPAEWTVTAQKIPSAMGDLPAYMAAAQTHDRVYMTMYMTLPKESLEGKPIAPILDNARDGSVNNVKGTLRDEKHIVIGDFPAREIIIDAPSSFVLVQRFFMMRNVLVQALVGGPQGVETEPDTIRFLTSLKVLPP